MLVTIIEAYQRKVSFAHRLLCSRFDTDTPLSAWLQRKIPKEGFLDDEQTISYSFHGVGCCITYPGKEVVDFDYGPAFRYDGFDPGRIYMYIQNKAVQYPEFDTLEKIEEGFGQLIQEKIIELPAETQPGRQYYFVEE